MVGRGQSWWGGASREGRGQCLLLHVGALNKTLNAPKIFVILINIGNNVGYSVISECK